MIKRQSSWLKMTWKWNSLLKKRKTVLLFSERMCCRGCCYITVDPKTRASEINKQLLFFHVLNSISFLFGCVCVSGSTVM
jgi:hypothetical protein